ncbi:MAG TPA: M1 family metallopeptidase, partial [Polyangiales bacterium]|nr:M1 family metallopeptidase [Polyangiales bacterium]
IAHVLTGHERIHFQNCSRAPIDRLLFHLYLNAFRDERSVFMREGGRDLRDGALGRPGKIEVIAMHADRRDLLASANRELVFNDFTQLSVTLPSTLPPSAAIDIDLEFRAELPRVVARSGFAGDFNMVGQWFPKLAKLNDDGTFAGFPYHGLGEFYADFADYAYSVTVPHAYVVAGSGDKTQSESHGELRTDHFVARRVLDVAWAASPHFRTIERRIGSTDVRLFAPLGYDLALARQLRVIEAALPYFERRYGAYPYDELSVVIPPAFAQQAAGMEYPGLLASGGAFFAFPASWPDPEQDGVVAHELAHQWFACMIASDEVNHPVLDEGLAEWSSLDFMRNFYRAHPSVFAHRAPPFELFDLVRALFLWRDAPTPSSLLPAYAYRYETLGRAVYMRPAIVLETIAERFGRVRLERALARYARAQRFRHPTPQDLFDAFDASFRPGFSARILKPALEGGTPPQLAPDPHAQRPGGLAFVPELLFVAQQLLHWIGA